MTSIKFLHGAANRILSATTWLAIAYQQGRSVLVYVPDTALGKELETLLWSQATTTFIPHCHAEHPLASETPIVIAQTLANSPHDNCLLNLSDDVPPHFSRFEQLVEIVGSDDRHRLPGRERYRFYRDRGYPLESQDISQGLLQ